jgi:Fis family transcriptional regulator, factor for inversion stimulation protein
MHPEHSYPTMAQLDSLVRQMQKDGVPFSDAVREFKKQFVLTVLRDLKWNQTKAACTLGIHRNTLARALRELGLEISSLRRAERRPMHGVTGFTQKKVAS